MQTSNYLKQTLFYQPSHATEQFFEGKSEALFQFPGKKSFIEVHHQQPRRQQKFPSPAPVLDSKEESDYSSVHPSILEQSQCSSLDEDPPPIYDKSPGLLRQDIRDLKDVRYIATVSALMIVLITWTNTYGDKGNKAPFPHMVSGSSKPSHGFSF